jgi:SAM-dependent methyltransferase
VIEKNVHYLYNRFRFGSFSFDRSKYNELLCRNFIPQIKDTDKVYDVGCGRGHFSRELVEKFKIKKKNIFCVDLSEVNIDYLKELGYRGSVGSNLFLDFIETNSADKTISNGVIHHTSEPDKCLDELIRITTDGGQIFLSVYSNKVPYYRFVWYLGTPVRYIFWNVNKTVIESFIFPLVYIFFILPLGLIFLKKLLKKKEAKVLFMDQLITPYAYSFHRKDMVNKIINRNCEIIIMKLNKFFLMDSFIIKVNK